MVPTECKYWFSGVECYVVVLFYFFKHAPDTNHHPVVSQYQDNIQYKNRVFIMHTTGTTMMRGRLTNQSIRTRGCLASTADTTQTGTAGR